MNGVGGGGRARRTKIQLGGLGELCKLPQPPTHFLQFRKNCDLQCVHCGFLVLRTEGLWPGHWPNGGGGDGGVGRWGRVYAPP